MANTSPNATTLNSLPPEVLEKICRELLALPLEREERKHIGCRTVAVLARTSRLLQEPALNTLWHTIPSLAVLFFTVPTAVYKRTQDKRSVRRSYVAATSAYGTLAKALKIQVLFPNIEAIHFISNDITPMRAFRAFHVLFGPKLQKLDIYSFDDPPPTVFVPPMAQADQEAFASMVHKLQEISPGLQELALSLRPGGSIIASAVSAVVPDLKHLVCLRLADGTAPISPATFAHLARLPNLEILAFSTDDSPWADTPKTLSAPGNAGETLFPALHRLHITAPTLALPIQLLRLVGSPHIESLAIDALKVVPRSQIRPLFRAIGSMPARGNIQELEIQVREVIAHGAAPGAPWDETPPPRPIGQPTLSPLLALPHLVDLMLNICCPFDVDDTLLGTFATTWPHMDRLILGTSRTWGMISTRDFPYDAGDVDDDGTPDAKEDELAADIARGHAVADATLGPPHEPLDSAPSRSPRATLFGLRALAARNPDLDVLGLELTTNVSAGLELPRERAPARRALDTLSVGLSPIEDPFAVAAFLSHSFVEIARVESSWEEEMEGDEEDELEEDLFVEREGWSDARLFRRRWLAVEMLVPMFEEIRRQERRWKRKAAGLDRDEKDAHEGGDSEDVLMEDDDI
ncbi:hypothetical protein TRAPUB_13645 [Trametes pubescens]|uniref:F-box domain-containing protein n=1 Tax=Trametes pubescens TaxID=154538 RepID=A0A1M2VQY4_TRAPU|nr:hypothetical protein TRAPUB_13645 [Trametes pubescens]